MHLELNHADGLSELPLRQAFPPILFSFFLVFLGVVFQERIYYASWSSSDDAILPKIAPCIVFAACGLAVSAARVLGGPVRLVLVLIVSFIIGFSAAGLMYGWQASDMSSMSDAGHVEMVVLVDSDPKYYDGGGYYFTALAQSPIRAGTVKVSASCRGASFAAEEPPSLGEVVRVEGAWETLDLSEDYHRSLFDRGFVGSVRVDTVEEQRFQSGIIGAIRAMRAELLRLIDPERSEARAFLAAVVCGYQSSLKTRGLNDLFADLGLSHLVAVSGSHLAVVSSLLTMLLLRVGVRPAPRCLVCVLVLGAYVCLTGFQISAIRSFIMCSAAVAGFALGRRAQGLASLGASGSAILACDPSSAWSLGFQLSVVSVGAIVIFGRLSSAWVASLLPKRTPDSVIDSVSISTLCQLATLPLSLSTFGLFPLLSIPANLLMGPLVGLIMVLSLFVLPVAGIFAPFSALIELPLAFAGLGLGFCDLLRSVPLVALYVEIPSAFLWGSVLCVAAALYTMWPKPSRRIALQIAIGIASSLSFMVLFGSFFSPAKVVVLDVGQGDAILIRDGASSVLVDTGPDEAILAALARQRCYHLDAIVLTHTDLDHIGGLDDLKGHVLADCVVVAEGVPDGADYEGTGLKQTVFALTGRDPVEVCAGDFLTAGSFELEVVWPKAPVTVQENEDSIVIVAEYARGGVSCRVLLTGDAEHDVIESLIGAGDIGAVDVLKVGHHGSALSTTRSMVADLGCGAALASAGEGNRYGHPTKECIEAVQAAGSLFLCTVECGDISVFPQADGVTLSYEGDRG